MARTPARPPTPRTTAARKTAARGSKARVTRARAAQPRAAPSGSVGKRTANPGAKATPGRAKLVAPTAVKKPGKRSTPRSNVTEARVINQGRTQYVILPKSFRLKGASVLISRAGDKVILEPMRAPAFDLRAWLDDILARGPEDVLPDDDASE